MTTIAGRPTKVLDTPQSDILVACRTSDGEDVYVPFSALFELFSKDIAQRMRVQGGIEHGIH